MCGESGDGPGWVLGTVCRLALTRSVVCEKRFNRPSSLATHTAVHTGAKREVCTDARRP